MSYAKMNKAALVEALIKSDALLAARNAELQLARQELSIARMNKPTSAPGNGRLEYTKVNAKTLPYSFSVARAKAMASGKSVPVCRY